jgi:hypothetical protein
VQESVMLFCLLLMVGVVVVIIVVQSRSLLLFFEIIPRQKMATTRRFKDESAIIYSLYEGMNQRGWACMREAVGSRQQTNGQTGISKR